MQQKIMPASLRQLDIIAELAWKVWPDTYGEILSEQQLHYMLHRFYAQSHLAERMRAGSKFYIYYKNDEPIGFCEYQHDVRAGWTKLHKLYVLPQKQGGGAGVALIGLVKEAAMAAEQLGVFLNVNRANKARYFYEKQGFVIVKEEDIDIGEGFYMNDFVMEWKND